MILIRKKGYLIQETNYYVKYIVNVEIPKLDNIALELDDKIAPKTVGQFIKCLPFTVRVNVWGKEIYTDPTPLKATEENEKPLVEMYDVAFWPPGNAICLFYGPTPIGEKNQIRPYSPVNVIGKIINPDKATISRVEAGSKATFRKA
jgi:hypothetical protein